MSEVRENSAAYKAATFQLPLPPGEGRGEGINTNYFPLLMAAPNGIKNLRELILEMAVRGKLVPQDPNDEPVSELLKRIRAEKARLVREGKIKREKPLPAVGEDEKLFELPQGWEWTRLGEVFSLEYGSALPEKIRIPGKFPVFGSNGVVGTHNEALITEPSLVIGRKGSVGAVNIATTPFWPIDTSYYVTPPRGIDLRFSYFLFVNIDLGKHDKATAIPGINRQDAYQEVIGLPPLAEQHRIVAKVDELMSLCDRLEARQADAAAAHERLVKALLDTLTQSRDAADFAANWQRLSAHFDTLFTTEASVDALKQTLLQLAVMGKLVPQDPNDEPASELLKRIQTKKAQLLSEGKIKKDKPQSSIGEGDGPFDLPRGWQWVRFGDIGELARGKSKHRPRNDPILFVGGTYPLVQTGDVARAQGLITTYTNLYNEKGLAQSRLWPQGTMCITIAANIADTAILGFDACFPDSVVGFIPYDSKLDVRFFDMFMKTAKSHLEDFAPSTAQKNINLDILGTLSVPLPPIAELQRIVFKVEELMTLCDALKARLAESRALHERLATALVEQAVAA